MNNETASVAPVAATWMKLRDGSWGVRITGTAKPGDTVTVTSKGGETKTATVANVVWTGNGVTLCSVTGGSEGGSRRSGTGAYMGRGGKCNECGRPSRILRSCRDSSGIQGHCCSRCAALSPWDRSFT